MRWSRAAVVGLAVVSGCSREPAAPSAGTGSPAATAPAASATPAASSEEAEAAAREIEKYFAEHRAELEPKIAALQVDSLRGPARMETLRQVLPAELLAQFDKALPALVARSMQPERGAHLARIGAAMEKFQKMTGKLPESFGELAAAMAKDDAKALTLFVEPGEAVPENIATGTDAAKAQWINGHTIYELNDGGKAIGKPYPAVVAIEKLDHAPNEAMVNILTGDLHLELIKREEVKTRLKGK